MSDDLATEARTILGRLPRSIEMPAGTGKTQLIVAMAREAARTGERALILTHTNAGVDARPHRTSNPTPPHPNLHRASGHQLAALARWGLLTNPGSPSYAV